MHITRIDTAAQVYVGIRFSELFVDAYRIRWRRPSHYFYSYKGVSVYVNVVFRRWRCPSSFRCGGMTSTQTYHSLSTHCWREKTWWMSHWQLVGNMYTLTSWYCLYAALISRSYSRYVLWLTFFFIVVLPVPCNFILFETNTSVCLWNW